ncbi:hypothetical protein AAG570_008919 [Ranatra chinensis]|uniref:Uncharacterized protein n=1 Tax=Ranatra chinensis TaxID=642074 RepID=A0ABD0YSD2_9HEMI
MIINCCQKLNSTPNALLPPSLTDIANNLLEILSTCKLSFENQILASIAFFQIKLSKGTELNIVVSQPDMFRVCLCNGLLQLSDTFWSNDHLNWNDLMYSKMFPVLENHCFQYTQLTLLSFKCLSSWLRKVSTDILLRILNVVMANWENPMNCVKEQNSIIFDHLLNATETFHDEECSAYLKPSALLNLVLTEQSWMMKSKYFLLSIILPKCGVLKVFKVEIIFYSSNSDIQNGLLTSLAYTHLASAGTELYKVCLESMDLEQWQDIFLQPITKILTSSTYMLQKQNVFNYWLPYTIKKYKMSLELLYNAVTSNGNDSSNIFPIICILKLGRKEGYEVMQWQHLSESTYLLRALRHSDETIRSQAFSALCVSSKASISPSDQEFQMVENFLTENINVDHAALRQNMLNNFTSFLCRVRDACLHTLKIKYHSEPGQLENRALTRSMIFLEWLYNFLKSNLEIGSNYQRMYTSLEIYKIVLSFLSEGYKVMKYAIAVGKWSFTSEHSREILLYCISNPAEDIRESAGFILTTYFKFNDNETNRFGELYKKAVQLCSDMMFYYAESGALLVQVVTSLAYKNGGLAGLKPLNLANKDDRVSSTLLSLASAQALELKADLLKAASQGSPLHGVLWALARLSTDRTSPEFASLTQSERLQLITIMETTVEHLLKVLAAKSSKVSIEDSDKLQLSPAYQLVLNCIWLNLRVCCSFSSGLVSSCGGMSDNEVERCWRLVISVLKQCRHKGALEVAGSSLGILATMLEKQVLLPAISQLTDIISDSDECPGMTQSTRGAGNVIFLHRLIANDARPNKVRSILKR